MYGDVRKVQETRQIMDSFEFDYVINWKPVKLFEQGK